MSAYNPSETTPKTSSLERIGVVFFKEIGDNLRDRRSIYSSLISTLIGPLLIIVMIFVLGKTLFADLSESILFLPVQGAENAPTLIQFLQENGVQVNEAPADPAAEVRAGNFDVVLVIPDEYAGQFSAGRPATLQIVHDSTRQSGMPAVQRVRGLLEVYQRQLAALRLMARGIDPTITQPVTISSVDMATPQSQSLIFLNMMPYFIILVVFVGGMYVIIDTTAGERERGSLEPLLINPVARWEFVIGKLMASLPFAVFSVFMTLLLFGLAFNYLPLEDYLGFQLQIDLGALAGIFLISLPMILLASALQMIIATFTRSFKEAQTYVGFLPLVPAMPGILLAFLPVKPSIWNMIIPTFGQQLLINQMMRAEVINPLYLFVSTAVTLVVAVLLIIIAIRLYQRERVIFGTR